MWISRLRRLAKAGRLYVWACSKMEKAWESWPMAVVLCSLGIVAACWARHTLPYPGISIGFLAAVAGIMSIRPPMSIPEKLSWAVVLGVFLVAEIHSIRKDKQVANSEAIVSKRDEDIRFANVLKDQDAAFGKILEAQNNNFSATEGDLKAAYQQNQQQFQQTISTLVRSHTEDEREFSGVLTRQNEEFKAQRDLAEEASGRLVPGDSTTPINACTNHFQKLALGELLVMTGDNADITSNFPHTILRVGGFPLLSVDRVEGSNSLAVSIDMRDRKNRVAFRMDKDGVVNRSNLIVLHPDKSTLLLQDDFGKEVLRAQFLNVNTFRITGSVAYCGHLFAVQSPNMSRICTSGFGTSIAIQAPSCPMQP